MTDFEIFSDLNIDQNEPIFTVGVVSRLLNIPDWVLKRLDYEGIVSPEREVGSSRLYSAKELKQIKYCWYLIEKRGVKLKGLKVIIEIQNGDFKME